jgi:hypothetical protein
MTGNKSAFGDVEERRERQQQGIDRPYLTFNASRDGLHSSPHSS